MLVIRTNGPRDWRVASAAVGRDVGGIDYKHDAEGNHYRPWIFIVGTRQKVGGPSPQLTMTARAVADAVALSNHSVFSISPTSDH